MRIEKTNIFDEWADSINELAIKSNGRALSESLGKVLPFKVKKKGNKAYFATFDLDITAGERAGQKITFKVTIDKTAPYNVESDYGKVRSKFNYLMFNSTVGGYGMADLPGHTGMYVLNTVARIVLNFANEASPAGIHFTAAESPTSDDGVGHKDSRRKAYRALAMMLQKDSGTVNITKKSAMINGSFFLMRKDLFESWQDAVNTNATT